MADPVYKDYRFGSGPFGYGIVGGPHVEWELYHNQAHGAFIEPSATGSSQLTGAGDGTYLYNQGQGFVVVDGIALNIKAAADVALEAAADIMADGYSKPYILIAYKKVDNTVTTKLIAGTAALHAAVAWPTPAEIAAAIPLDSVWIAIGGMMIARTGATTVTETPDNLFRPYNVPKTYHG